MNTEEVKNKVFSPKKTFVWLVGGIFFVLTSWLRDAGEFWRIIYKDLKSLEQESDMSKLHALIDERFMRYFQKVLRRAP